MAIKRNSCRTSERKRMKKLSAQGFSIPQVSNAVSVHEHIVSQVLDGSWDALMKEGAIEQRKLNEGRAEDKANEKVVEAAAIAMATVQALKAAESADVQTQAKTEDTPATAELSPQQRGAETRRQNKLAAENESEVDPDAQAA